MEGNAELVGQLQRTDGSIFLESFGNREDAKEILKDLPDELSVVLPFAIRMFDALKKQEG